MSERNVELVREAVAAWGRDDISGYFHPDVTVIPPEGWPEAETLQGLDAWRRQLERLAESWDDPRSEPDEVRALDDERVLIRFRYIGTVKGSGLTFERPMGAIYTVREGLVVHAHFFPTPEEALAAAGLSG